MRLRNAKKLGIFFGVFEQAAFALSINEPKRIQFWASAGRHQIV